MDVLTHKCPNCGGPLTFDPKDQKFHCEYCLNIYTEEEVSQYEQKQKEARMAGEESKEEPSSTEDFTFTAQEQLTNMSEAERKEFDEAGGFSDTADEAAGNTVSMDLFLCPNCGAEIVTDATTACQIKYFLLLSRKKKQSIDFSLGPRKNGLFQKLFSIRIKSISCRVYISLIGLQMLK